MEKQLSSAFMKVWTPITLEHVEENPRTFNTEKELRDYCKQRGLSSGALL